MTELKTPEEEWRKIPGYENYSASSNGRIRLDGGHPRRQDGVLATPRGNKYLQCRILRPDGSVTTRRVHILVALAFLGPKPRPDLEVNHINGNKLDNRPDNLEYITSLENEFHAAGWLKARGNNHGARFRKLLVELVDWVDSPEVQGTFQYAATRMTYSPAFVRRAGRLWDMAHALVAASPEKKKRDSQTDGSVR